MIRAVALLVLTVVLGGCWLSPVPRFDTDTGPRDAGDDASADAGADAGAETDAEADAP